MFSIKKGIINTTLKIHKSMKMLYYRTLFLYTKIISVDKHFIYLDFRKIKRKLIDNIKICLYCKYVLKNYGNIYTIRNFSNSRNAWVKRTNALSSTV